MPTNGKRDKGKGCPAAAPARPAPGRRSRTAPRCRDTSATLSAAPRSGSGGRLGSQALFPVSLPPNRRVAHRRAGKT